MATISASRSSAAAAASARKTTSRTARSISTEESVHRDLPLHFFVERYEASYLEEMRAFVAAVMDDQPVPVTGEDARAPALMGLAARKSYEENRPVLLSEISG